MPTLVLQCAEDVDRAARRSARSCTPQIAGSRLVTLDATGHCPQLSAPEATTEAIVAFADWR